jgi:hypothetical protein
VGGVVAAGRLFVEEADASARLVDRVGRDLGAVAVNRIEEFLLLIEGDELRIGKGLKRLYQRPRPFRVDAVDADALGMRFALIAGKAPDIGEQRHGFAGLRSRSAARCSEQASRRRSEEKEPPRFALGHRPSISARETATIGCHNVLPCRGRRVFAPDRTSREQKDSGQW